MGNTPFIVCRCEEVTLEQIIEVIERYHCSSRETKLRTRAGMGICGGRTCRPLIDRLTGQMDAEKAAYSLPLKVQPPVRPISFGEWGRGS
ncbi:(2Fe-2S)-binding protein [Cohnella endophytica]|uniref:(2Fe-2S)-binding protein n=1 Tax=Cohnella endophytica TaxID=2419778 RepID=A0A494XTZ3_9BACL|nr:(2Fe-2S)-binding protein [Cohnella endophytica]RKP54103.1 (2Fe-2S)-binding protein [Cohnella endophytica]